MDNGKAIDRVQRQFESAAEKFPHFRVSSGKLPFAQIGVVKDTFGPGVVQVVYVQEDCGTWFYESDSPVAVRARHRQRHILLMGNDHQEIEAIRSRIKEAHRLYSDLAGRIASLLRNKLATRWTLQLFVSAEGGELAGVELYNVLPKIADGVEVTKDDLLRELSVDPFTASAALIDLLIDGTTIRQHATPQRHISVDVVQSRILIGEKSYDLKPNQATILAELAQANGEWISVSEIDGVRTRDVQKGKLPYEVEAIIERVRGKGMRISLENIMA